jgi:hypothetical protein
MEIDFEGIVPRVILSIGIIIMLAMVYSPMFFVFDLLQTSGSMNCPGFDYDNSGVIGDSPYDYNSSLHVSSIIACNFPPLIPALIMIGALLGCVVWIFYGARKEQFVPDTQLQ